RSFSGGSGMTNLSGGTVDISADGTSLANNNTGTFNNNSGATFKKSAGAGTSTVQWAFNNSGDVQVQSGTLSFTGGGNYGGTISMANGALYTSGANVSQTGGTLAAGGDATSTLTLNGNFDWSNGTLGGNGIVNLNGGTWSTTNTKDISTLAANVRNSGTIS